MKKYFLLFTFLMCFAYGHSQTYSDSISVNFFLIDECRISQNISGEINDIYDTFIKDNFQFHCYFPNRSSSKEKIEIFMDEYKLDIPYSADYEKENTLHYGASIAPEVVVYDEKNQQVLYKGRIDNSYDSIGSRRRVITSRDLRDALQAIVDKNEITNKETKAIGCFLNVKSDNP